MRDLWPLPGRHHGVDDRKMEPWGVELRELSMAECRALLASAETGNLAVSDRALPAIVPVRICDSGDEVTVESLLGQAVRLRTGSVVALSVGTMGGGLTTTGWTVEVRGFLHRIDGGNPQPMSAAELFRLSTDVMTGWSRGRRGPR